MTTESIQFFGFFAAVFVFCAVAEWMFAAEAVNYGPLGGSVPSDVTTS